MVTPDARTDQDTQRAARRAALDYVLALAVRTSWADALVLRGSMAMLAWGGASAREPADLDWVAAPGAVPIHPLSPYPYVDDLDRVQEWPEAGGGAAAYELFRDEAESFETGGLRAVTPPEGTRWIPQPEPDSCHDFVRELVELLDETPPPPPVVEFDAWEYRIEATWDYTGYADLAQTGGGVRVLLPWSGERGSSGHVQVDIAFDEPMAECPVHALIPRADGGAPTLVHAASRELSLAWKLLWLHSDIADHGRGRGKDLYDAVILAESPDTRLQLPLLRRVLRTKLGATADDVTLERIREWDINWDGFRAAHPHVHGDLADWLDRLTRAVRPSFTPDPRR